MLFLARLLFSLFLLSSGGFCLWWVTVPGARKEFAGYKVILGVYNIAVGLLCLYGAFKGL